MINSLSRHGIVNLNTVPPCTRKKKMIKEPSDPIIYLPERTGNARVPKSLDW